MAGSNNMIRVAPVQWRAGNTAHLDLLYDRVDHFVHAAADYSANWARFLELFTPDLAALEAANQTVWRRNLEDRRSDPCSLGRAA